MKSIKLFFIIGFLLSAARFGYAQTINDVFNSKIGVTWLGIDFTAVQLIGDNDQWENDSHTKEVIVAMNNLMLSEKAKYDFAGAIGRSTVDYQIEVALKHNAQLNLDDAIIKKVGDQFLSRGDIQEIVSTYDFDQLKGIGMMIIAESLNKTSLQGTLWVTFVNMDTKEVLFTEKMVEPPGGFGLRNYWAFSIYKAIKEMKTGEFQRWRQKYYRKNLK